MASAAHHNIHRHPAAPWFELRDTTLTHDGYRPHTHSEYSIGIVDEGQATFLHDQGPHALRAGSVVLIEPDVVHACNPVNAQRWSYRMLFIDAGWLHQAMARHWALAAPPARLSFLSRALHDPAVRDIVDRLCQPVCSTADAQAWAEALGGGLAQLARPAEGAALPSHPPELAPALQAMKTRPDARLTVSSLAQACGMSTSHFIRRFKAAFQLTPGHYLLDMRVKGARQLLAQGVALAEAAHSMGFADQAHLQRAFKAHHAMTPGRYAANPAPRPGGDAPGQAGGASAWPQDAQKSQMTGT